MHHSVALDHALRCLSPFSVSTDPKDLHGASFDNLRVASLPAAVIKPRDEEEIAQLLQIANAHRVPVTTRGAGSATTGSASPVEGGWVLDLSAWKELQVDAEAKVAYVQPGVTVTELDRAAAESGLFYPPDPGSKNYATLGGTIATNAGGLRGAKYGVTRDYVLSLEGFLPTGEFVRWGAPVRKYCVGYNLRDLWIGSEGTLGIITGAVIRLISRPSSRVTAMALFPMGEEALRCGQTLLKEGWNPSILEFLDEPTVACTVELWGESDPTALEAIPEDLRAALKTSPSQAALLIELDGTREECVRILNSLPAVLSRFTPHHAIAGDDMDADKLWKLRRSCSQAMFRMGQRKLNEDVVVPMDFQIPLLRLTREIACKTGLATPTFGHMADGNFHVHIMFNPDEHGVMDKVRSAIRPLMEKVVEAGGAISGEHGVGLAKTPFLQLQLAPAEIRAMQSVKKALDPNGILNPHLIFHEVDVLERERVSDRLPWDH